MINVDNDNMLMMIGVMTGIDDGAICIEFMTILNMIIFDDAAVFPELVTVMFLYRWKEEE